MRISAQTTYTNPGIIPLVCPIVLGTLEEVPFYGKQGGVSTKAENEDFEKPFEGILGTSSEVELLEYLLSCPDFTFNITELAKISEVPSRRTCNDIVKRFLKWGILVKTDQVGNIKLYRLNKDSEIVQTMYRLNKILIAAIMEKELGIEEPEVVEAPVRRELVREETAPLETLSKDFTAMCPELVVEEKRIYHIRKRTGPRRLSEVYHA
ncbi:MAG: hypothetical protein KAW84_06320 [Thermoplasmata archaeon]|nr:hypothetical protein [Thermoplasmata archaeon]